MANEDIRDTEVRPSTPVSFRNRRYVTRCKLCLNTSNSLSEEGETKKMLALEVRPVGLQASSILSTQVRSSITHDPL